MPDDRRRATQRRIMAQDTRGSESKVMGRIVNYCVEFFDWNAERKLNKVLDRQQILFERQEIIMAAIDNLNTNLAKLKADVEALLAKQTSATEAQIQAAADNIAALDAEVVPAG